MKIYSYFFINFDEINFHIVTTRNYKTVSEFMQNESVEDLDNWLESDDIDSIDDIPFVYFSKVKFDTETGKSKLLMEEGED